MCSFWCNIDLIGVAREIRDESDRRIIFRDNSASIFAFRFQNILKKYAPRVREMIAGRIRLRFNRLKNKIRRIDLAVRMRIGDSDYLSLVLEYQNVRNIGAATKFAVFFLPHLQKSDHFRGVELSQRQIVLGAVTYDACNSARRAITVNAKRCFQFLISIQGERW